MIYGNLETNEARPAMQGDPTLKNNNDDWADDYYGTDRDGRDWKWHLNITEDMDDDEVDEIIRERIRESGELIEFGILAERGLADGVIVSNF